MPETLPHPHTLGQPEHQTLMQYQVKPMLHQNGIYELKNADRVHTN
ncbi:hypothetical protein STRCR_1642 [Streptococcus criceti HS-6]|uniref:Uncharacterized protein n=1 Tax=Streptococcus criceti HS-6 TaxID=873449 RepID=G5JPJ0_STRCG|nr:hypothetical protein STRCR_1642 [Streptococcus criceti HS-6]